MCVASSGIITLPSFTMHGNINVKLAKYMFMLGYMHVKYGILY
jgi:hypothetical protein